MGVTIRVGGDYSLDMTDYDLDVTSLGDAYITSYNKTTISGYVGSLKVVINGKGFAYSDDGLVGGTVTGFTEKYGSSLYASVSGLNLSVKTIVKLAESGSESAIRSAVKTALSGADDIYGSNYTDVLFGYGGNDTISGNRGSDQLYGGAGNDKLIGGIGADALFGEGGKDTFVYKTVNESSDQLGVDTIFDFSGTGGDRIDLSGIDANTKTTKNDAFSFIGSKAFSGAAGELRVEKQASETYVYGDTNGDKVADFQLHLDDPIVLGKGFFIL
jgi:Ca2+-binding RTX toxin-like protein